MLDHNQKSSCHSHVKRISFGIGLIIWSMILILLSTGITFHLLNTSTITPITSLRHPQSPPICQKECIASKEIQKQYNINTYDQAICCAYHTDLRLMLEELDTFFKMQDISYWLSSGTLIGSVRSQSIIPWDLDADLYLPVTPNSYAMKSIHLTETYIKLLSWSSVMPGSIYVLRPGSIRSGTLITSFKLHRKDHLFVDRINIKGPKVDLQLVHMDETTKNIHISNPYWYNKFVFPKAYIYPLKTCALYNKQYPCPNQSKKYLQLLYSDDVLNRVESIKDYWNLKHGQGPKKKSNQEKNHQKK